MTSTDSVTFSDNNQTTTPTSSVVEVSTTNESKPLTPEEYCRRHPDSPGCLEYDV